MAYLAILLAGLVFAMSPIFTLGVPSISYEAIETLLNMDALVTITSLKDNAVPLYRKDLPRDNVAYWEVVINKKDFVIVSAGPDTRDYRLIYEGRLPTFTSRLNRMSRQRCARYFMFAPDAGVICEDVRGNVVAVNLRFVNAIDVLDVKTNTTHKQILGEENIGRVDMLNDLVRKGMDDAEREFERRAKEIERQLVWADTSRSFLRELSVGETVKLPVILPARVVALDESKQGDACSMTGLCDVEDLNNGTAIIGDALKTTSYGVKYAEFEVKRLARKTLSFHIVVAQGETREIWRRYVANIHRRRSTSYMFKRIPYENLFPSYHQFMNGKCFVGSGAVAWGSVFAYLSRRSFWTTSAYNKHKNVFRDGNKGLTGYRTISAPRIQTARIVRYMVSLNKILKTRCIGKNGATAADNMDNVESFYKARIKNGKIQFKRGIFSSLVGTYEAEYRLSAINMIDKGFPAIIGWKVSGKKFKQHYPIATKYRWKRKNVQKCNFFTKCNESLTVSVKEYQFYLHMGWGGAQDGWYPAEAYMAVGVVQ